MEAACRSGARAAAYRRRSGTRRARRTTKNTARTPKASAKSREHQPEQLGEEHRRHHGARDAPHQRGRRLALDQRLGRHDDAGEHELSVKHASIAVATNVNAPSSSTPSADPGQPRQHQASSLRKRAGQAADDGRPEEHADADHRADDAEQAARCACSVLAHEDRDQRSEAADREAGPRPSPSPRTGSPSDGR